MQPDPVKLDPDLSWPALPLDAWRDTYATLHMWTQVVGKIRLTLSPPVNHWWHSALYVNSRGLTTSPVPYGAGAFEVQFDFINHHPDERGVSQIAAAWAGTGGGLPRQAHGHASIPRYRHPD